MTDDISNTVDNYLATWNETDADARAALIEKTWVPDGRYVDPLQEAEGYEELSEMIAGVHLQFPGHRLRRRGKVDTHHNQLRFVWDFAKPDGEVVATGIDTGEFAEDGRLRRITGFFGEVADLDD
jgi:hypothetical protein